MSIATRLAARRLQLRSADTHRVGVHRGLTIPTGEGGGPVHADHYYPRDDARAPLVITTTSRPARRLIARLIAERGFQVLVINSPSSRAATLDWLPRQPWYPGTTTTLSADTLLTHLSFR